MLQHDPGLAASPPVRYILKWGERVLSPMRPHDRGIDRHRPIDPASKRLDPSPRGLLSSAEGVTHPQTPAITSSELGGFALDRSL
jgi:hypothetical protein